LLAASGFAWFLGTFADSTVGVLSVLGLATLTLHRGPLFHAILGYPTGKFRGWFGRMVVAVGYVYASIAAIGSTPVATLTTTSLVGVATIRRHHLAIGPERGARARGVVAVAGLGTVLTAGSVMRLGGESPGHQRIALWGYELVLVLIAAGFLVDLLRGGWARATITKLVVELGELQESGMVRHRLARALGDASLEVAYWVPQANGYLGERGDSLVVPEAGSGRAVTVIEREGERIAALVHDPASLDDPELVEAVAATARIAVSNVRLRAEVRRQVDELTASRRRIVEAADRQRRMLQEELREGAARHLDTAESILGSVRVGLRDGPGPSSDVLELAVSELDRTRRDLRELAEGIHPMALTEGGVAAALGRLSLASPLPVVLAVSPGRMEPAVESAVYFVCAEALANVAKHASASTAAVEMTRSARLVRVSISDDGVGGADPAVGSGLRGLVDRVEALGGRLQLDSRAGEGTRIVAEFPLGLRL
jgi:signal transduction histidine kinase